MKAGNILEYKGVDHSHRCFDDDLVHVVVYYDENSEWLRHCDLVFLPPKIVDASEDQLLTCIWCAIGSPERVEADPWI